MLGGTRQSEPFITAKPEDGLPSQIDELTAANSSNHCCATTAFSVGMSPANISMQRRRQRSEALIFDNTKGAGGVPPLNNYESYVTA